jgi:flagellar hook-associated protein 2
MSTSPISLGSTTATSANNYTTGSNLTSLGSGTPLQVTGLASGLNTNAIVQALMSAQQQQVTNLTNQENGIKARNTQLQSIQTALQAVANDAQALETSSLFANSQTVTSTNPTLVSATATGSAGAVVGGYQVSVSQLASSAQRTFAFASPSSADTVTIDGQQVNLAAGASAQDLVNAVNGNSKLDVWATATNSGTVVLSDRATGLQSGSYIQVSDTANALTEQAGLAQAGQNALYSINGATPPQSSPSNTVTTAIPGVTLSLNGLTTTSGSVTVNVGAPGPSTQNIQTAIQTFIKDYNSAISLIQTQLSQTPSSSDPTQGTLYGDSDLTALLSTMRQAMYASGSGLPAGMASMLDIGVGTGASSGGATTQNQLSGDLTLDTSTLTSALQSNPGGVHQVLASWGISFSNLVNNEAAAGGTIDTRVQGDTTQINNLATQLQNLTIANTQKQNTLVAQFAQMESVLAQNQSESTWLTSQISALPTP